MTVVDLEQMVAEESTSAEPISFDDALTALRVVIAAGELGCAQRLLEQMQGARNDYLAHIAQQEANAQENALALIANQSQANPGLNNTH